MVYNYATAKCFATMFHIFDKHHYLTNVLEKLLIKEKVKGHMDFDVI